MPAGRLFITIEVPIVIKLASRQSYVKLPVPPVTFAAADPVLSPKQLTGVTEIIVVTGPKISLTLAVRICEQSFISVTVT